MNRLLRYFSTSLGFLLFFSYSHISFGADYSWYSTYVGQGFTNATSIRAPSASELCSIRLRPGWQLTGVVIYPNGISGSCQASYIGGTSTATMSIQRAGDSCPAGTTYNAETGSCDAPQVPNGEVCGPKHQHTGLPKIKNSAGECVDFQMADKPSQCKFAESRVREVTTIVQFDSNGVPSG